PYHHQGHPDGCAGPKGPRGGWQDQLGSRRAVHAAFRHRLFTRLIRHDRQLIDPKSEPFPYRESVMQLSRFFIDRPIFAAVIAVIITLVGAISYFFLPI